MSAANSPAEAVAIARTAFETFSPEWIKLDTIQPSIPYYNVLGEALRPRLISVETPEQDQLCLRFDMTVPAARAWAQRKAGGGAGEGALGYEGLVYRFNPTAAQRSNEHVQVGVEVFGRDAASGVDADLVIAAWGAVEQAGVANARVTLGDVGLFEAFVTALGVSPQNADRLLEHAPSPVDASAQSSALGRAFAALPREEAERAIEEMLAFIKLDDVVGRDPQDILDRLIAKRDGGAGLTDAARELITRYLAVTGEPMQALDEIAKLAAEAGANLDDALRRWSAWIGRFHDAGLKVDRQRFDADLGRGFSYYDGPVFEIEAPEPGKQRSAQFVSLGGGGRYDSLVGLLSERAVETPAAGAILRPERLATAAGKPAGGAS